MRHETEKEKKSGPSSDFFHDQTQKINKKTQKQENKNKKSSALQTC
jgi:hypothetical protein